MATIMNEFVKHYKLRVPMLLILLFLISSAIAQSPKEAVAQSSAEAVCQDVARKAQRTLWSSVRESADELFCRKSWVSRRPDEFAACGLSSNAILFGNKVKNKWNAFFTNAGGEWATWGARGIDVEWEEGTIRGGVRRTFFGVSLAYNTATVEVVKESGRAEANITVCELDYDSNVISTRRQSFSSGQGNENEPRTFEFTNKDNRILGVVVDTPASINSFEYRTRLINKPIRNNIGPVPGISDLHVHQLVNLAFGGRMYWGQHAGDKATALAEEVINGPTSLLVGKLPVEDVLAQLTAPSIDANILLWIATNKRTDEGFSQLGGGGYPTFAQWPHHADRTHQQVHISWLKEAHERHRDEGSNLNLLVVSVVNNDILCTAMKLVDAWGNVPIRDSQGKISGWESASWGCSDHDNVLRQLKAIHQLENDYPWYRVAMTPWHARQIIADGDLAVVISLETDKLLSSEGGNYGNWLDQLDRYRAMGVTTMPVVHESNSRFCGAAPHRNMLEILQAIHWPLRSLANALRDPFQASTFNLDGERYNTLPLTKDGEELVDGLVKRNMPIDLAHGSQRCRKGIMNRVPQGYGLYDSHTKFKRLLEPDANDIDYGTDVLKREQEFLIMESILPDYVKHKVLVGLRTASVDVYDAPNSTVLNNCPGSANSFAQLIQYADFAGLEFAYGTDFNTGVSQLGPRFNGLGKEEGACWADLVETSKSAGEKRPVKSDQEKNTLPPRARQISEIDGTNYYVDGLANIGWLPELTEDLIALTPVAKKLRGSAEAYLAMWERAYSAAPQPPPGIKPGSLDLGLVCTANDQCRSGSCSSILGARGVCVCNENEDCPNGLFCNMGLDTKTNACQPFKAMGEACTINLECREGKCSAALFGLVNGKCVCDLDTDCPNTQYCYHGFVDIGTNQCRAKKSDGQACTSAAECSGGGCKTRCYTPDSKAFGQSCEFNAECRQGTCSAELLGLVNGSCVCTEDRHCGEGNYCNTGIGGIGTNRCTPKLANGKACTKAHQCKSNRCNLFVCKE